MAGKSGIFKLETLKPVRPALGLEPTPVAPSSGFHPQPRCRARKRRNGGRVIMGFNFHQDGVQVLMVIDRSDFGSGKSAPECPLSRQHCRYAERTFCPPFSLVFESSQTANGIAVSVYVPCRALKILCGIVLSLPERTSLVQHPSDSGLTEQRTYVAIVISSSANANPRLSGFCESGRPRPVHRRT